jgi:hypothetical protein
VLVDRREVAVTLPRQLVEQTAQEHLRSGPEQRTGPEQRIDPERITDPERISGPEQRTDPVAREITSLGQTTGPGSPARIVRDNRVIMHRARRITTVPERQTIIVLRTTRLVRERRKIRVAVRTVATTVTPAGRATVPITAPQDAEYRVRRPAGPIRVGVIVGLMGRVETRGQIILLSPVPHGHRPRITVRLRRKTGQVQTIAPFLLRITAIRPRLRKRGRLLRITAIRRLLRKRGRLLRHDRTMHRNVSQGPRRRLKANHAPKHALLATHRSGHLGLSNLALRKAMMAETKTRKRTTTKTNLKTKCV